MFIYIFHVTIHKLLYLSGYISWWFTKIILFYIYLLSRVLSHNLFCLIVGMLPKIIISWSKKSTQKIISCYLTFSHWLYLLIISHVIVHGTGAKLVSNWEQNMFYAKSCRKYVEKYTDLKVSFLLCKCVFYRLEHNAKGGPRGTDYIPTDRAQRVDEKIGSFSSYYVLAFSENAVCCWILSYH